MARAEAADRIGCLRRTFDLAALPPRAPARVTADSRYILWVNGSEVARGPLRANTRRLHYDTIDLAPYLRAGRNVIAVLARFYGRPVPWWAPAPATPQLGGGAFVLEARVSDTQWLLSDDSWRGHSADAWSSVSTAGVSNMPLEAFDARRLAAGWNTIDFDDKDWTSAVVLAANFLGFSGRHEPPTPPYGALQPRPIPQLGRVRREAKLIAVHRAPRGDELADPVEQVRQDLAAAASFGTDEGSSEATGPASIAAGALPADSEHVCVATFDFGEIVSGTVILDVDAPAGTRFDLAAGEFVGPGGVVRQDDERLGLRYVARGANDRLESFDSLGFRCASVAVRAAGPVRLRPLAVCERLYPRPEGLRFVCSDPQLEQIWAVGRRTVDLCSHDAYLDCPTREQRAWTGDFVVHQMVDLATSADWRLARWNVELAASPRPDGMLPMAAGGDIEHLDFSYIPDWALHWIRALHNLYRYTGDRELVARLLPVAENVLRWFVPFQDSDGLLTDVTGWIIIDWSSVTTAGKCAALNGLWARGLTDFAEMGEWLGDGGRAAWARAAWAAAARGFEAFWDPQRRLYVDHVDGGTRGRPFSQPAQAAALVGGVVPAERAARVVEVMLDRSRYVHTTWSRASGDARQPRPGESGVGGPYLVAGPPSPWWDVETQMVVAQPFFRYVVHDALAVAGREDLVAEHCLDWTALLERCATTWSETWYGGTTCHGWCATPTRDLIVRTLGITPAAPGFVRARVAPRLGHLEWARGAAPTPFGWIQIDARRDRLTVDSPVPFELVTAAGVRSEYRAGRYKLEI